MVSKSRTNKEDLKKKERHKEISKQWVRDIAVFLRTLGGEDGARASMTPSDWARKRMIAGRVVNHPNAQDYEEWTTQMTNTLKGQEVWDTNLDTTVDFLTANAKYDEMANVSSSPSVLTHTPRLVQEPRSSPTVPTAGSRLARRVCETRVSDPSYSQFSN